MKKKKLTVCDGEMDTGQTGRTVDRRTDRQTGGQSDL